MHDHGEPPNGIIDHAFYVTQCNTSFNGTNLDQFQLQWKFTLTRQVGTSSLAKHSNETYQLSGLPNPTKQHAWDNKTMIQI